LSESRCQVLPESGSGAANATILIVARERLVRAVTRRILERQSFRILEACNAREAIAVFHANAREVHGAVVDLGMPGTGADRIAGEFRRTQPTLPILFTGSYGADVSAQRMIPDPTTGFLATPFGLEALAKKAGNLFGAASIPGNPTDPAR